MTVLIVGEQQDPHVQRVSAALERREVDVVVADLSGFPRDGTLSVRYTCCGDRERRLVLPSGGVDLEQVSAVWWRRPQHPEIDEAITDPAYRNFALNEASEALSGLWHSLEAFWINDPAKDHVAHRKVYQLRVAQDVGLKIPDTLVTNDPTEALRFVDHHGYSRVIYKAFSATESHWRETRLLRPEEVDKLADVSLAPVIFQEYVEAVYDLRITVVGDRLFPAAIHSQDTSYPVDFRMDMANARVESAELPEDVEQGLLALMRSLGLVYGAIDMRLRPDGEYVFLEINPAGQFLFIEEETGQPIAEAMAEALATAGRPGAAAGGREEGRRRRIPREALVTA